MVSTGGTQGLRSEIATGTPKHQFQLGDFCEFLEIPQRHGRVTEGFIVGFLPPKRGFLRPRCYVATLDGRLSRCSTAGLVWLPTPLEIKETCLQIRRERGDVFTTR